MVTYKNPGTITFDGPIVQNTDVANSSGWVVFPYDVLELYGVRTRVPVKVTFDGIPYTGSMVKMGGPDYLLLILKDIRTKLNKAPGEVVHVEVSLDTSERKITLPPDALKTLKQHPAAYTVWERLSYSHQREYFKWIEEAKRPETRVNRIEKMCEKLVSDKPGIS